MMHIHPGIASGLAAAVLFGASVPLAKQLIGQIEPLVLAALLYLGSGIGLGLWMLFRRAASVRPAAAADHGEQAASGARRPPFARADAPWLAGAVISGGVLGPVLLMTGLQSAAAHTASLLLNLETVLTALLAWFAFREPFDRRIFSGMVLIVLGGALLSWDGGASFSLRTGAASGGAWWIAAACLCWAIDNNLTRKVAANDAMQIAAIKGLAAGTVNLLLALWLRMPLPSLSAAAMAAAIGFCGYGLSLVLFVVALRQLGTARTGAYFSVAPFAGAALALLLPGTAPGLPFWSAAALMAAGVWLHLTESHSHVHTHARMAHSHVHRHDEHHRHAHDFPWDGVEPHAHPHRHEPLMHEHPHFPDIHHRHEH